MKSFLFFAALFSISTVVSAQNKQTESEINILLNQWHKAAADANFDSYFAVFSDDAIYIGTDATENWNITQFKTYSKPYFDKGKAWNFTTLERNVFFSKDGSMAWFDELLDTQMKICRGSGVLLKEKGLWKIVHYVLSMTVPNEITSEVVKAKSAIENQLIKKLNK